MAKKRKPGRRSGLGFLKVSLSSSEGTAERDHERGCRWEEGTCQGPGAWGGARGLRGTVQPGCQGEARPSCSRDR